MAVEDKYIDSDLESGDLSQANVRGGSAQNTQVVNTFEVASADDDGSKYRLFRINSQNVLTQLHLFHDAITGGTDYDVGLYETVENGGAVVDADIFADGISVATATAANAYKDGMVSVDRSDYGKSIAELLSLTRDPNKEYDVVITGNTVGTVSGTIAFKAQIC